ncbi:MAG: DUF1302 family protein [Candidatus Eisenbacteria bacterium]
MRRSLAHSAVIVAVFGASLSALPSAALEPVHVGGYVRHHTSVIVDGGDYSIIENTLDLTLDQSRGSVAFRVDPYVYQRPGEELDMGLRQAYVDIYWDSVDLRVGRQQVIWGKGDGVFITDVVSPKDLRRFLIPDFEEIRIGVDALKLDYYRGSATLELIWVPVFAPSLAPDAGSIWARSVEFPAEPSFDPSSEEVEASLENSEVFAKYSLLSSSFDIEVMAGHAWDDEPALHTSVELDPDTGELLSLVVAPQHHRLSLAGGSFSTEVGGTVVRGEGAYYWGKHFATEDPLVGGGVLERDYVHYLLGVDWTLFGVSMSAQFIQEVILDHDDSLASGARSDVMTFLLSDSLLNDTLNLEFFSYVGLSDGDALLRPKVSYDVADGFEIQFGADLFVGDAGVFGTYDANDSVYAKLKYSF